VVELAVRVIDTREIRTSRGLTYYYLFEDESGQVEGVGQRKALAFGSPTVCFLRGKCGFSLMAAPAL